VHAATRNPLRARLAVIVVTTAGRIFEKRRAARAERRIEPRRQFRQVRMRRDRVEGEIEESVAVLCSWRHEHVGPAPDFPCHEAAPGRGLVGACHRAQRHRERIGEVALWRQPVAWLKPSGLDVAPDGIRKPLIIRPFQVLKVWLPDCHRYNIAIDTISIKAILSHMSVPVFQVDAFASRPFGGNPAGVCLLEKPATAEWMQHVAAEMNVAETAFVVPGDKAFGLRWFTPTVEVGLCGHATLASAHALWEAGRVPKAAAIAFETLSGILTAERDGDRVAITLPARRVVPCPMPDGLVEALGATARAVTATVQGGTAHGNVLVEFGDEAEVRSLTPRFIPKAPAMLRRLSQILGYERAEALALRYRAAKRRWQALNGRTVDGGFWNKPSMAAYAKAAAGKGGEARGDA